MTWIGKRPRRDDPSRFYSRGAVTVSHQRWRGTWKWPRAGERSADAGYALALLARDLDRVASMARRRPNETGSRTGKRVASTMRSMPRAVIEGGISSGGGVALLRARIYRCLYGLNAARRRTRSSLVAVHQIRGESMSITLKQNVARGSVGQQPKPCSYPLPGLHHHWRAGHAEATYSAWRLRAHGQNRHAPAGARGHARLTTA